METDKLATGHDQSEAAMHRSAKSPRWQGRVVRLASWMVAGGILLTTLLLFESHFQTLSFRDVEHALARIPPRRVLIAMSLTAVSFAALASYDVVAVGIVATGRVAAWRAAFAGLAGNAVSNTLGFHAITGSAVRYRIYRDAGLGFEDIARVISLSWAALALGFLVMLGLAMLFEPAATAALRLGGAGMIAALAGLLIWRGQLNGRSISVIGFVLPLPSSQVLAAQMLIGAVEMAAAIGALYALLAPDIAITFPAFALSYIAAVMLGTVSHAPGGIGVFEATMMSLVGDHSKSDLLAALLLYRFIYNLLPFILASAALVMFEFLRQFRINSMVGKGL